MLKTLVLQCDHCLTEDDSFSSDEEAMEFGWYLLSGPERELGGGGMRAYCSLECLVADL